MTHLIVAIDRKGAIGHAGDQLYYIKEDLKHFKSLTMGNTIIMGRKTFEALRKGALPGRKNIVVTRNRSYRAPGAEVAHSLAEALSIAPAEAFIIGGAEIYRQALPMADTLHITVIDDEAANADTFFPAIPLERFRVTAITSAETTPPIKFYTLSALHETCDK